MRLRPVLLALLVKCARRVFVLIIFSGDFKLFAKPSNRRICSMVTFLVAELHTVYHVARKRLAVTSQEN